MTNTRYKEGNITLNLTEALHLIPKYLRETDILPLNSTCDTVVGIMSENQLPLFLKTIVLTKLTGKYLV